MASIARAAAFALLVSCASCGEGGSQQAPTDPTDIEMVTVALEGDFRVPKVYYPFSMSHAGDITVTLVEYSTPYPERDSLVAGLCHHLDLRSATSPCWPIEFEMEYDLNGNYVGSFSLPGDWPTPISHTWRLPASQTYALGLHNRNTLSGPEFTYKATLTHPR